MDARHQGIDSLRDVLGLEAVEILEMGGHVGHGV
jgi:hypothetical protein